MNGKAERLVNYRLMGIRCVFFRISTLENPSWRLDQPVLERDATGEMGG